MTEFQHDHPDTEMEGTEPSGPTLFPACDILAEDLLHAAIPAAVMARLDDEPGFALVVTVPSIDWIDPVAEAVKELRHWDDVIEGEASPRKRPGSGSVAKALGRGCSIAGIASAPERQLPAALLSAADARIDLTSPSDEIVRHAIEMATGGVPSSMPAGVAAGLDFFDLVAAIRMGSTPDACVDRLVAASKSLSVSDRSIADVPRFEDMCGLGVVHPWGMRLIQDFDSWRSGRLPFDQIDRHCVLASAPGLGKTTLVRSLAKSLRLPLFATSVAQWFTAPGEGYLHNVMKEAERVFAAAAANSPAVLLLDELDALPDRATVGEKNRDYWTPLITQILLMLDSATSGPASRIVVIGATNHVDRLDAALIRPGRLNRVLTIHPPDAQARAGIMRQHLGGDLPDADLVPLADLAIGATGAQIMGWVKTAKQTARHAERDISLDDLVAAIAPPDTRSNADRTRLAYHEAGHAVLSHRSVPGSVRSISIIPNGDSCGGVAAKSSLGEAPTRADIEREVVWTLGGRAAEIVFHGEASTGSGGSADSDLAIATRMIASLHATYGLGTTLTYMGPPGETAQDLRFSPALKQVVDKALATLHAEALRLVEANRPAIQAVAEALLARRHLGAKDFVAIVEASDAAGAKRNREGARHG